MSTRVLVVGIVSGVIVITEDGGGGSGEYESAKRKSKDQFKWRADKSTVKSFDVDFGELSPFESGTLLLHGDSNTPTPPQRVDSTRPPNDYKYTVTAKPQSGPTPKAHDPHIIINDGGLGTLAEDLTAARSTGEITIAALADALAKRMNDTAPDGKRFFFPFGIQSISVDVKVAAVEVNIQVTGTTVG